ncbi:MAG: tRNA (adenosine(37)-N6)-threonylcarbamoyltransferase complex dimerization subunit type 1 TsaB [Lachnospiraceae bacterium]|nr:tRNA (adenosine(37)-N6)-threonylcarbamoyltransferase complex dimerization subunit type 1 TsaB [Lachnospiraceae bacterium]
MKIVAIDSSGLVASVAIVEDEILVAEYNIQYKKTHSQTLLPMLDEIKRITELSFDSVDAIAIAAGPGSFTGLRIGSATAKALGFALEIPLVEIPTLEGMAFNLYGTDKLVCPLMDARRNQVYTGVYAFSPGNILTALVPQCVVPIDEIAEIINKMGREVIFSGDGVPIYAEQLASLIKVPFSFAPAHLNRQRAASLAVLAFEYMKAGKTVSAGAHQPHYFRLSQAEQAKMAAFSVLIRPMNEADIEAISEIESRTFSMPWKAADFLAMITADFAHYYVAEIVNPNGEKLAGTLAGAIGMRNISGDGQITNILVDVPYRRNGIGEKLLKYMLKDLGNEVEVYSLEVRAGNSAAISLYEKLGFKKVGSRPDFYEAPVEDALLYAKTRA